MRTSRNALYLPLALLAFVSLSACDQSEQNYEIEPGENLSITGPSTVTVPAGEASFNIFPFTTEKSYEWSVDGPGEVSTNLRRDGEYFDVTLDEPGTYTVSLDDGEYTGTLEFTASYADVATQASRLGFGTLATAAGAAGLSDTLTNGGPYTVLAPTDEAFAAALDANGNDSLDADEIPAAGVLADILQYHVIPDSLSASDLAGGTFATLEGDEVSFSGSADALTVNGDAATVTQANVPASNGLIHAIDAVLLPSSASVSFGDQASADGMTISVGSVYLPEGGFVAVHDSTLLDGNVAGSVIGVSEKLEAGLYNNVEVTLFDVPGGDFDDDMMLEGDQTLIAMPHFDTNGNGTYDFVTSGGAADGAYTEDGSAVVSPAEIAVGGE